MQGEMYDADFDNNLEMLHELHQQAIDFMKDEGHANSSQDY